MRLYLNRKTAMHRDSSNAALPNIVVAVSSFQGGGIWVEDSQGTDVQEVAGSPVNGIVHDLSRPLKFDAHARYRCTMPWEGDRLVAVAFGVAKLHAFALEDVNAGFPAARGCLALLLHQPALRAQLATCGRP